MRGPRRNWGKPRRGRGELSLVGTGCHWTQRRRSPALRPAGSWWGSLGVDEATPARTGILTGSERRAGVGDRHRRAVPAREAPRRAPSCSRLAAGQFLMTLDSSVMNVSIATVAKDVGTTITGIQTAITLYTLVMAMLMIPGGKVGSMIGRKRAFALGCVDLRAGFAHDRAGAEPRGPDPRLVVARGRRRGPDPAGDRRPGGGQRRAGRPAARLRAGHGRRCHRGRRSGR